MQYAAFVKIKNYIIKMTYIQSEKNRFTVDRYKEAEYSKHIIFETGYTIL